MSTPIVKSVEKQDLEAVAGFYNVPAPVAKMMFAVIGDTLYPKLQFLLYPAHKKGVQRIELSQPKEINGEWITEARIHPYVPPSLLSEWSRHRQQYRKKSYAVAAIKGGFMAEMQTPAW